MREKAATYVPATLCKRCVGYPTLAITIFVVALLLRMLQCTAKPFNLLVFLMLDHLPRGFISV